jgi:HSP20 family molecular chaperone IbpA
VWDRSVTDIGKGIRFNISETDQTFEVEASLPGLQKDDIKVNLKEGTLTLLTILCRFFALVLI